MVDNNTTANHLQQHPGFTQVFQEGKLTFGFVAPMDGYPNGPLPDMANYEKLVRKADTAGVDVIWLRDVPFLDPLFGDAGQVLDPLVYAGWLSGITKRMAIGTAGIVLPLRDPLIVAKQAASIDHLSGGRFLLGLASGDRYSEYPAFGVNFENKAARYREARDIIRVVTENEFPQHQSQYYGVMDGGIDLIPKPVTHHLPTIAIGRAGQTMEWIAENTDGWIWHGADARRMVDVIPRWKAATNGVFKPYGYGLFFDLSDNPDEPIFFGRTMLRGGRNQLIRFWEEQLQAGLSHAVLNLKPTRRPAEDIIEEFGTYIIPYFRSLSVK
ncbi:LLM class oxidoreductase [Chitinophaga sp. 30R24]|uniref:LLM class oxidoreductase n=1 Tax=Chitinophaga sp. 30R24 TaxID=3248838 RepID=UPI003B8F63D2